MNRTAHGAVMQPGSHTAPYYGTRRGSYSTCSASLQAHNGPVAWSRVQENDHAPIDLRRRRHAAVGSPVAVSRVEENDTASLSTRAALKLSQVAQTAGDIASGLLIAIFILLLFASPFIALGCLLLVRF